jgi:hypothetical protein
LDKLDALLTQSLTPPREITKQALYNARAERRAWKGSNVHYCLDVKFRTPKPIAADKLEEVFEAAPFKRPLQLYRPEGMNKHGGWLAVESCGYADYGEAKASGARFQEGLLIIAAKQKLGVEFYLRDAATFHVYP